MSFVQKSYFLPFATSLGGGRNTHNALTYSLPCRNQGYYHPFLNGLRPSPVSLPSPSLFPPATLGQGPGVVHAPIGS